MESKVEHLPVSHKAWAWFEANKKPTLYGAGAVLVVGVIVAFFLYRQSAEEMAASEALSKVSVSQMTGAGGGSTADAYLKVAAEHPKSSAGARALLLAAGSLYGEGKYDEAKTQFDRFKREYASSPFIGQALLGVAACLDAKGNAREAMAAYQDVIARRPGDYVVSQARFSLARLHVAQNEPEKARILLEEVERSDPYSSLGSEAGMRLEELKQKYPKLFAPAAPLPTAPAAPSAAVPAVPLATNPAAPKVQTPK
jgi:predicted negative regulator of RcsB-dependent stress response